MQNNQMQDRNHKICHEKGDSTNRNDNSQHNWTQLTIPLTSVFWGDFVPFAVFVVDHKNMSATRSRKQAAMNKKSKVFSNHVYMMNTAHAPRIPIRDPLLPTPIAFGSDIQLQHSNEPMILIWLCYTTWLYFHIHQIWSKSATMGRYPTEEINIHLFATTYLH